MSAKPISPAKKKTSAAKKKKVAGKEVKAKMDEPEGVEEKVYPKPETLTMRFKQLSTTMKPPVTQKARGVWCLVRETPFQLLSKPRRVFMAVNSLDPKEGVALVSSAGKDEIVSPKEWKFFEQVLGEVQFGRPCPKTPRHGFVESIRLSSEDEFKSLYQRALENDPEAEMLLMPFIGSNKSSMQVSGIFVPESGALIMGPDHDGATGGHKSITIPICVRTEGLSAFREKAGIANAEHIYVELVSDPKENDEILAVQARSGPPIPIGITEYIPATMAVSSIIEPTNDLLAWESLTRSLAGIPGLVAWQPGGSLGAHAAIHAATLNKIPFLTRKERPSIGDVIEPPAAIEYPIDLREFVCGVQLTECEPSVKDGLKTAIAILHNTIPLKYSPHYSRLLGYACGWIFRGSALCCLGESRHYKGQGDKFKGSRNQVYEAGKKFENGRLCRELADFSYKFMHTSWSSSYGGFKWYAALVQAVKLWNLISESKVDEAVAEANILLNMAHNGGWLLNKFVEQATMTQAQNNPGEYMATAISNIYQLATVSVFCVPIQPRRFRASAKWDVKVEYADGKQFQVNTNGQEWKLLDNHSSEHIDVLKSTFENI